MGQKILPLEHWMLGNNFYNFTAKKPMITDPCGSNMFAQWENKQYVLLCGGIPGLEIRTVDLVVLSLGIEVTTEDFFDSQYLVRNLASLFGIPTDRMRVPRIVAGSKNVDIEIGKEDLCEKVASCGVHGRCYEGECICDDGWRTPQDGSCTGGDCMCSEQVGCASDCVTCVPGNTNNASCTSCGGDALLNQSTVAVSLRPANLRIQLAAQPVPRVVRRCVLWPWC